MINTFQTLAVPWHNRRYIGRHRAEDPVVAPRSVSSRLRVALPLALARVGVTTPAPASESVPSATGD